MPAKKIKLINLLPQDRLDATTFGRILKWLLSSFRVMVILTELIVMSAFLSRFWLDAKNSDLNESIQVATAQIKAYEKVEKEFRNIQTRLEIAKELYAKPQKSQFLTEIATIIPQEISLSSISFTEDGVQIKGYSQSESAIAQLLTNIEAKAMLKNPTLSQISSSTENPLIILFVIKGI